MKKTLLIALLVTCFCSHAQTQIEQIKDFGSNPGDLEMFLHKPHRDLDTVKHLAFRPLVVVLHGCNQSAKTMSKETGWNKLADYFDFFVIYPSQSRFNNPSDCFNWFNKKDISKNSGESGSIKQMIDYMRKNYGIDSTKIFVYGLSAGAAMTSVLLATYPETFNAGAVFAGGPYKMAVGAMEGFSAMVKPIMHPAKVWGDIVKNDNPNYKGNYPRLVVCHGKDDKIVNPKNSYELIKQWSGLVGTDTVPTKTIKPFNNHPDIEKKIYCSKDGKEKIIFYEASKLGHTLMVDPGEPITQGGETGLFSVDKNFFSTYWIAKDFGLIP